MSEEILFHYTNEVGLQGILQNKCLWATDVFSTNDKSEVLLGKKLFNRYIEEWLQTNDRSILAFRNLQYVEENIIRNPDYFKGIFLTCFSSTKDEYVLDNGLLSQWRGYGSYAIKFKKDILQEEIKKPNYDYSLMSDLDEDVRYYYEEDYKKIEEDKSLSIDEFKKFISTDEWMKIEQKLKAGEKKSDQQEDIISNAAALALIPKFFIKHKGFEEEKERRIVVLPKKESDKKIHFHAPYKSHIKLFEKEPEIITKAIQEIIIGPVSDKKAAERWVRGMLEEFGYKDVKVKCSGIPFRKY